MRRITTALLLAAAALCFGALPAAASDEPEQRESAPTATPPVDTTRTSHDAGKPAAPAAADYVVQEGDTLETIAAQKLGTAEKWRLIAEANGIDDPRSLRVGQKLRIPARDS
jgi:nucleoid-associated protein YgaU